jgi:hypothetical protein
MNEKYSKNSYDNPNYYVSLVIFQTYKNVIWKNVHSFRWFLWFFFLPKLILYHIDYAFMTFIMYIWTTFVKATFSKSINFKIKNMFKTNVLKSIIKKKFISSNPFVLLIIISNLKKERCTFAIKKKVFEKNKDYSFSKFECFNEHAKIILICVKQWACKLCN